MDFFFNMQFVQTIILNGKVYYIKWQSIDLIQIYFTPF